MDTPRGFRLAWKGSKSTHPLLPLLGVLTKDDLAMHQTSNWLGDTSRFSLILRRKKYSSEGLHDPRGGPLLSARRLPLQTGKRLGFGLWMSEVVHNRRQQLPSVAFGSQDQQWDCYCRTMQLTRRCRPPSQPTKACTLPSRCRCKAGQSS